MHFFKWNIDDRDLHLKIDDMGGEYAFCQNWHPITTFYPCNVLIFNIYTKNLPAENNLGHTKASQDFEYNLYYGMGNI